MIGIKYFNVFNLLKSNCRRVDFFFFFFDNLCLKYFVPGKTIVTRCSDLILHKIRVKYINKIWILKKDTFIQRHLSHAIMAIVQRKITRTLFFKQFPNADVRPPYCNRLIGLDIVRVEDALKIQRLILGFKILNDLAPASFGSYIQHSRLVKIRLLHQASRISSFFNSMFISLSRLWDEIPSALHVVSNLSSFKVGCKSHYLSMLN